MSYINIYTIYCNNNILLIVYYIGLRGGDSPILLPMVFTRYSFGNYSVDNYYDYVIIRIQ